MQKLFLLAVFFLGTGILSAQYYQNETSGAEKNNKWDEIEKRNCITIGILQGGGSLVGADFEFFAGSKTSLQIGAGFFGFGAGINYHFQPTVRSSFLSLQYWHQGIGDAYAQSVIGPNFVYRGKKWFTFQMGMGAALEKGPAWPDNRKQTPVMFTYAIGAYLPI